MLRLAKSDMTDLVNFIIKYNMPFSQPKWDDFKEFITSIQKRRKKDVMTAIDYFKDLVLNCHSLGARPVDIADSLHEAYKVRLVSSTLDDTAGSIQIYYATYMRETADLNKKVLALKILNLMIVTFRTIKLDPLFIFMHHKNEEYLPILFNFIHPIQNSPKLEAYIRNALLPPCDEAVIKEEHLDLNGRLLNILALDDPYTSEAKSRLRDICVAIDIALRRELSERVRWYAKLPIDDLIGHFRMKHWKDVFRVLRAKSSIDIARYFSELNIDDGPDPLRSRNMQTNIHRIIINLALAERLGMDLAEHVMNMAGDSLDPNFSVKELEGASGWKL